MQVAAGLIAAQLHKCINAQSLWQSQLSNIRSCLMASLQPSVMQQLQTIDQSSCAQSWHRCGSIRGMAGRTHKLSLKKANNKASWLAVQPYLEQQPEQQQQAMSPVIDTAIPSLPMLEEPLLYRRIGKITGPYSIAPQSCFAILESGGSQFKVTADDIIYHNKIPGVHVNDVLEFGKVLLLGGQAETTIGRPFIPGASVVAAVEETFKDAKVYVFKKKVRKRYTKLFGHRSHITALRILEVRQPGQQQEQPQQQIAAAAAAAKLPSSSTVADSSSSEPVARATQPTSTARKRLPMHLVGGGRRHGPPAVSNISSIAPAAGP